MTAVPMIALAASGVVDVPAVIGEVVAANLMGVRNRERAVSADQAVIIGNRECLWELKIPFVLSEP